MTRDATCPRCKHTFPIPEGETSRPLICPRCHATTEQAELWLSSTAVQRDPPLATQAAVQTGPPFKEPPPRFLRNAPGDPKSLVRPTGWTALFQDLHSLPVTLIERVMAAVGLGVLGLLIAGFVALDVLGSGKGMMIIPLAALLLVSAALGAGQTMALKPGRAGPPIGAGARVLRFLMAVPVWAGVVACFVIAVCVFMFAVCAIGSWPRD